MAEKREIVTDVTCQMLVRAGQALVGIYGYAGQRSYALHGSSTFLKAEDRRFLVTANHVLQVPPGFEFLAHYVGENRPPLRLNPVDQAIDQKADVALVEIDPLVISEKVREPLTLADLAPDAEGLEGDILFLQGLPGEWAKPVPFAELHCTPLGYPTQLANSPSAAGGDFISVDYDRGLSTDLSGVRVTPPHPEGMSGSASWKTNRRGQRSDWRPSEAQIVGVVVRWAENERLITVARIEAVHRLLGHLGVSSP